MIKINVKGEFAFGLPLHYEELEIGEPSCDAVMEHYNVDPKVRSHLLPIVNDEVATLDRTLTEGDSLILSSPYSGG